MLGYRKKGTGGKRMNNCKKKEDELMLSPRDSADLSQSYIYRKKIRQGLPVPFKGLQGDATAKLDR